MNMKERVQILNDLLEKRGCEFAVQYCSIWKNNHCRNAYRLLNSSPSSPAIYEDEWFYKSDEEVVEYLINQYKELTNIDIMSKLPEFTYEYVSKHIRPMLVSETNISMLQDEGICYHRIENTDLLAIFYIAIESQEGMMSCKIKYWQLEKIGMNQSEAYELAVQNQRENIRMYDMADVLVDMIKENIEEVISINEVNATEMKDIVRDGIELPMYAVSTKQKCKGASAILCAEARKMVREKLGVSEFIIIPSSIHECIVTLNYGNIEELKELVRSVNCDLVDIEDKLSDSLYICRNDKIEML